MSGLVGFPSIWVSPPECLFGRFQLDLGFWLNMLLRRRLYVKAGIHYPLGFWPNQVGYISLGTSHKLNSFNCRSYNQE